MRKRLKKKRAKNWLSLSNTILMSDIKIRTEMTTEQCLLLGHMYRKDVFWYGDIVCVRCGQTF